MRLVFKEVNRDIFKVIQTGKKKVETRTASTRYKKIALGDVLDLVCGKDSFSKKVKKVKIFKDIEDLLKVYSIKDINPSINSKEELIKMYLSFPGYKEKIKRFGIIAIEL